MACVENISAANADSEMEEGEIVDEIDELSDISSEEEFLLRQRLQVLENYNNVLERKKAKDSSVGSEVILKDLSDISASELEDNFQVIPRIKLKTWKDRPLSQKKVFSSKERNSKLNQRTKRKKEIDLHRDFDRHKGHKKKSNNSNRKRLQVKIVSETSEESDDEYRNKRRKLADAVVVPRNKNDKSSLHARLQNMLCVSKHNEFILDTVADSNEIESNKIEDKHQTLGPSVDLPRVPAEGQECENTSEDNREKLSEQPKNVSKLVSGVVDVSSDDGSAAIVINDSSQDDVQTIQQSSGNEIKKESDKDSDEDLELLRQHALKTKTSKTKPEQSEKAIEPQNKLLSEDEDSDTTELRLICLKSALLKKAIERKQKQKLKKRLSQSSNIQDDFLLEVEELENRIDCENNNTDIESVDMDIGSDGEDRGKENNNVNNDAHVVGEQVEKSGVKKDIHKEDELEEDEDLLRAKLLTSLSKNLPNLVDPNILSNIEDSKLKKSNVSSTKNSLNIPEEKRIVINVGESDSEGEHEATKNLTKMHMKLSEQVDFQQKLDMFLKSTRMEVEKSKPSNNTPNATIPPVENPKPAEKFVAKAVNNLPKSEQIEYRNLVKRMAELEKIKRSRQTPLSLVNKDDVKETLKPRNISVATAKLIAVNNLEEQIALSRKKIAEESARIISLKEEATKLTQKYKIVATELKNISTAITFNKKQQRTVQNKLSKIREQHQNLLNSSIAKHSNINGLSFNKPNMKIVTASRLQKENNPTKEDCSKTHNTNLSRVSVPNDERSKPNNRLSQPEDVSSKKTAKMPANKDKVANIQKESEKTDVNRIVKNGPKESDASLPVVEKGGGESVNYSDVINTERKQPIEKRTDANDYESPLQSLDGATWEGDPNAILCPFEVGGHCKDADCKYLHPKIPAKQ